MQSTHLTRAPLRGSPPTVHPRGVYRGGAACPIPNKKNTGKTKEKHNKAKTKNKTKQKTQK